MADGDFKGGVKRVEPDVEVENNKDVLIYMHRMLQGSRKVTEKVGETSDWSDPSKFAN